MTPSTDPGSLLRPRAMMYALIAAQAAARPQVGAELLADLLVHPGTPYRGTVIASLVPLLNEALDPLVFGGLVERTALEGGVIVYSVTAPTLVRLISTSLASELVRLGLEEGPAPVVPLPRRPGLIEAVLSRVEGELARAQGRIAAVRRRATR